MPVFTLRNAVITGADATGSPISATLSPGPVDFSSDEEEAGGYEALPVMNGGDFLELVPGMQKFINFSLTLLQDGKLTDGATGKPFDLAMKQGTFAAGTTRDPGGLVWTVNVVLTLTRNGVTATKTFTNCRLKVGYSTAIDGNKIALTGTAYGTGTGGTLPVVTT
jgi:hypothetical protein